MITRKEVELEYVYVTIPAEYICVYHRILAMLADYGEQMLKDCKASCTDRNSGVIECFNMFNAAVAARKLGKDKLAQTLIKYIKAKINQIYGGEDNSTSFVFPVDENGQLKAFVSCGERPKFEIDADDMHLYAHKFDNGFTEHFQLGPEDKSETYDDDDESYTNYVEESSGLYVDLIPDYHLGEDNEYHPCAEINIYYNGKKLNISDVSISYYFDDTPVIRFNDVTSLTLGVHEFKIVVIYNGITKVIIKTLMYANNN